MTRYKIQFDLLEWTAPMKGVRFKEFIQHNKKVRLVEYTSEFVEPHWCEKGHIGYVISGHLEIDYNGTIESYQTGDSIYIPAGKNHKHKARILSDIARVFLVEDVD